MESTSIPRELTCEVTFKAKLQHDLRRWEDGMEWGAGIAPAVTGRRYAEQAGSGRLVDGFRAEFSIARKT
ncbi:MAG: hypothetical protein VB858_05690 [Planctomycetaceae bacterium]